MFKVQRSKPNKDFYLKCLKVVCVLWGLLMEKANERLHRLIFFFFFTQNDLLKPRRTLAHSRTHSRTYARQKKNSFEIFLKLSKLSDADVVVVKKRLKFAFLRSFNLADDVTRHNIFLSNHFPFFLPFENHVTWLVYLNFLKRVGKKCRLFQPTPPHFSLYLSFFSINLWFFLFYPFPLLYFFRPTLTCMLKRFKMKNFLKQKTMI